MKGTILGFLKKNRLHFNVTAKYLVLGNIYGVHIYDINIFTSFLIFNQILNLLHLYFCLTLLNPSTWTHTHKPLWLAKSHGYCKFFSVFIFLVFFYTPLAICSWFFTNASLLVVPQILELLIVLLFSMFIFSLDIFSAPVVPANFYSWRKSVVLNLLRGVRLVLS